MVPDLRPVLKSSTPPEGREGVHAREKTHHTFTFKEYVYLRMVFTILLRLTGASLADQEVEVRRRLLLEDQEVVRLGFSSKTRRW